MLRPHYPTPLSGLLLVFTAWMITSLGVALQIDPNRATQSIDVGGIGIAVTIAFALVGTFAARRVPAPRPERLGLRGFEPAFAGVLIALLPFVFLASEADNWLAYWFPLPESVRDVLDEVMAKQTTLSILQNAIYRVGLEPVVTEWLLRGVVLQGAIAYMGRVRGMLFTAIVGLGTLELLQGTSMPSSMLLPFAGSLVLCAVRVASGSLLAPILLHMGWNAILVAAVSFSDVFPIDGLSVPGTFTSGALLLVSAASVGFAWTGLSRGLAEQAVTLEIEEEPDPEEEDESGGFF